MELKFETKMTVNILYDYMLHHTYNSFSGIFGSAVGALMVVTFFITGKFLCLVAGVIILLYLPFSLFTSSVKQLQSTPTFQKPLTYKLSEEGIEVSQDEQSQLQKWEDIYKAISTPKSIIIYNTKVNAWIFPRKDMGEATAKVIEMISTHMAPDKVKIRW